MEEEIKPQVISTINYLCKNYIKLIKFQSDRLNLALNAKDFSKIEGEFITEEVNRSLSNCSEKDDPDIHRRSIERSQHKNRVR